MKRIVFFAIMVAVIGSCGKQEAGTGSNHESGKSSVVGSWKNESIHWYYDSTLLTNADGSPITGNLLNISLWTDKDTILNYKMGGNYQWDMTFNADGTVNMTPYVLRYTQEGNSISITAPTGEVLLYTVSGDTLTNEIVMKTDIYGYNLDTTSSTPLGVDGKSNHVIKSVTTLKRI